VTAGWWLAGACVLGAAVLIGWAPVGNRTRWRAIVGEPSSGDRAARSGRRLAVPDWIGESPKRTTLVVAGLAGVAGAALGGPVAAIAGLAYGGLAARAALRRRTTQHAERARRRQLDGLCALAADLRAGLPVSTATLDSTGTVMGEDTGPSVAPAGGQPNRITGLARSAVRLAEQTGAPLADLLDRIEADARAMDRGLAAAAAQAAGARATAMLLAGLPLGGIALGYGIGVDPLAVLLRTPIGAGCAVGAIGLQLAGLAWADRLGGGAVRAVA
jgi:tight adherence protein B